MKKLALLTGILAMALVFGMTVVGCDDGSSGGGGGIDEKSWAKLTAGSGYWDKTSDIDIVRHIGFKEKDGVKYFIQDWYSDQEWAISSLTSSSISLASPMDKYPVKYALSSDDSVITIQDHNDVFDIGGTYTLRD